MQILFKTFHKKVNRKKKNLLNFFLAKSRIGFTNISVSGGINTLFFMLGGEYEPAMFLACWLLGHELPMIPVTFKSKKHHCEVNLHTMIAFLTKDKSPSDYHSREFFQNHKPTGKDEHFASLVGICRSATVFEYKHDAKIDAKQQVMKGNRFFTEEKVGERIDKQTRLVEKEGLQN